MFKGGSDYWNSIILWYFQLIIQMPQGLRNNVGFLLHFGGKFILLFPVLFRSAFLLYHGIKNYTRLSLLSVLAYTQRRYVHQSILQSC